MNCLERVKKENTELVTVEELLSNTKLGQNCYRIPDYQRGFAWDSQFEDLWKDIIRLYKSNEKRLQHYTGMIALEPCDESAKKEEYLVGQNAFYVVDGQQRLTSIIIILQSIKDYLSKFSIVTNIDALLDCNEYVKRFQYSNKREDQLNKYFQDRIYGGVSDKKCSDLYLRNINKAKVFIDNSLKKYDEEEVQNILSIILKKIVFNVYFITKNFDVRVTFETMNNRGKKLSNLELLKNRLMYLTTFLKDKNLEEFLKKEINNSWNEIYTNLSYDDLQLNDDEFLRAHWFVYKVYDKKKSEAYIKDILSNEFGIDEGSFYNCVIINKNDKDGANLILEYIRNLSYYSKYWGLINNPQETYRKFNITNKEIKWLDKLNRIISMNKVKPVVMVIAGSPELSDLQKVDIYKLLEKTIFVNKLLRQSKNDYGYILTETRDLLHARGDKSNTDKKYNALIDRINVGELNLSRTNISNAIENLGKIVDKTDFFYNWDGLRYFLYEYDNSLTLEYIKEPKEIEWIKTDIKSIEHILPQTPTNEYWQRVLLKINNEPQTINKVTNSLGNMLLLSSSQNSILSNCDFNTKKDNDIELKKYAYIYGTRAAQKVAKNEIWSLNKIYERNIELFNFMFDNWINCKEFSKEDFYEILKNNKLLIEKYEEVDDETKIYLKTFNNTEIKEYKERVKKVYKYEKIKDFVSNDYEVYFNTNNIAYITNRYTFKEKTKTNCLQCGIEDDDKNNYKVKFELSNKTYSIKNETTGLDVDLNDKKNIPAKVQYIIDTVNRFQRYNGEDKFVPKELDVKCVVSDEMISDFWKIMMDKLAELGNPFVFNNPKAKKYFHVACGKSAYDVSVDLIPTKKIIRVNFNIYNDKNLFKKLYNHKDNIENEFGHELSWESKENQKGAWIFYTIPNFDFIYKDNHSELITQVIDEIILFKNIIPKYINS